MGLADFTPKIVTTIDSTMKFSQNVQFHGHCPGTIDVVMGTFGHLTVDNGGYWWSPMVT